MASRSALLPFLLPRPLPRPATIRSFLSSRPTPAAHRSIVTVTTSATTESYTSPTSSSVDAPLLPYHVSKSRMKRFAVYQLRKNGGNLLKTRVKHVFGNAHQLRDELKELLQLEAKDIKVNPVNRHVEMKGWYKDKICDFLEAKNFEQYLPRQS